MLMAILISDHKQGKILPETGIERGKQRQRQTQCYGAKYLDSAACKENSIHAFHLCELLSSILAAFAAKEITSVVRLCETP